MSLSVAELQERKTYIGSTEAADLLGVGFRDAAQVYADKVSDGVEEFTPSLRMEIGTFLEPFIAELFRRETGCSNLVRDTALYRHPDRPWQACHIDYTLDFFGEARTFDCKSIDDYPDEHWGETGSDKVPEYYFIQMQHQMGVCGEEKCFLGALFRKSQFRFYCIDFDPDLFRMLTIIQSDFWDRVQSRSGVEGWRHPLTGEVVSRALGVCSHKKLALPDELVPVVASYQELGKMETEIDKKRKELRTKLEAAMGDAEFGELSDGKFLHRKYCHRKSYTVQATDYVSLTVKRTKKEVEQ